MRKKLVSYITVGVGYLCYGITHPQLHLRAPVSLKTSYSYGDIRNYVHVLVI